MAGGGLDLPDHWAVYAVNHDHVLMEANEAFLDFHERYFGIRPRVGESILEGLSAPERKRLTERFAIAAAEGGFTVEERHYLDADLARFVAHYCPVFDEHRAIQGFRVFLEEVTARYALEGELKRTREALEQSYHMRETVFAVLGHDLRGPVSQINALVYLMRDRPDFLNPERIRSYADDLEAAGSVLTQALENLLHWARVHRAPLTANVSSFVADKVLREAVESVRVETARKRLRIGFNEGDPVTLETDRFMLAFIARNFLANAVKFTPTGGAIEIEQHYDDAGYRMAVRDSGVGMPAARRASLLGKQPVESAPGTEGERGVGLGLRVCHGFAECMGGRLDFESGEKPGTTVVLHLPRSSVAVP